MKYIYAKVGTMAGEKILVVKGPVKLGGKITWVEGPDYRAKYGRQETGIIDDIRDLDGTTLYFIRRF